MTGKLSGPEPYANTCDAAKSCDHRRRHRCQASRRLIMGHPQVHLVAVRGVSQTSQVPRRGSWLAYVHALHCQ